MDNIVACHWDKYRVIPGCATDILWNLRHVSWYWSDDLLNDGRYHFIFTSPTHVYCKFLLRRHDTDCEQSTWINFTSLSLGMQKIRSIKSSFFFLRHRRPVAVPKGILDLCKLFMQIYGILSLFRDITAVTAIVQVRKWRKTCREIILDRMIQLEKRSVFLSSIGLSQVCNKAVISKTGYRLWNL